MAQTGEDGGGPAGPERLRALHDGRFAEPDARFQPGPTGRPMAVAAPAVRPAGIPVAPADRLPELPDAARRAQPVAVHEVPAVAATDDHHTHVVVLVLLDIHVVVIAPGIRRRPQDIVHSGSQAQGQGTRGIHHQGHANGLEHPCAILLYILYYLPRVQNNLKKKKRKRYKTKEYTSKF